jgi:mutator protein MutT
LVKRLYPKQPVVGVGAIIIRNGEILIEKRKSEPGKGKWSVPGGLVELGENTTETVIREVKEETGLDVEKPELIDVVDNIIRDENGEIKYHFVIVDYFVKLKSGEAKASSDAEELRWVPLSEVEKYDLTKTFRTFLQKNRQKLEKFNSCL